MMVHWFLTYLSTKTLEETPMKDRESFNAVLNNCDDQVIVRQMLNSVLTDDQKQLVVEGFNDKARQVRDYQKE